MNDNVPPPIEPAVPPVTDLEITKPIGSTFAAFESVLRAPRRVIFHLGRPEAPRLIAQLAVLALVLILLYGVIVGTFSGGDQLWIAPVKVAGGLLVSALICLPSLYILACLGGSKAGLRETCGLMAGLLALMTVLLIGFAPVAWVFSQSTESAIWMGALHLLFMLVALYFGLRLMKLGFVMLGATFPSALNVWIVIFLLVLFQMTTALRPIVGTADTLLPTEKKFFLRYWGENLDPKETR